MRQAFRLVSLFVILPWLISPQLVGAFEKNAHNALAGRAVSDSGLNSFLRDDLGIPGGTTAEILGQQIVEWVQNGSISEDSPRSRVLRHFHDPTRPWADAGLGGGSSSSVLWAQDQFQSASWQNARDRYSKSLTLRTRTERDSSLAKMFWVLGHVVHLVQDAASPAHTREDPHPCIRGEFNCDLFHQWADSEAGVALINSLRIVSLPFNKSILDGPANPVAPIPIARIMDNEKYITDGIPRATTDIGIAEYSNANFLSDQTIWSIDDVFARYPFPNEDSADLCNFPKDFRERVYLCKNRDGDTTGYKLAVASSLQKFLEVGFERPVVGLDNAVMEDYGKKLFPRAIGYGAGLIDYFFRGRLKAVLLRVEGPLAAFVDGAPPFTTQLSLTNESE